MNFMMKDINSKEKKAKEPHFETLEESLAYINQFEEKFKILTHQNHQQNQKIMKLEDDLKLSEKKYSLLIENLHAGVVVHAADTSIIDFNQQALRVLGLEKDQILGKKGFDPAWHFQHDDGTILELQEYPVNKIAQTLSPIKNQTFGINRPGPYNDTLWVNVNGVPLFDEKDQLEFIIITFVDFTARRNIEINLKTSEEQYRNLVELSSDLIFNENLKGEFIFINRAFDETLGYSKEELIEQDISYLIHPDDLSNLIKAKQPLFEGKDIKNVVYRFKAKNGQYKFFSTNASPLFDSKGKICEIHGIARDVTELKKKESDKIQKQRLESVGTLAGGLAHDFNNILVGILGNLNLLQQNEQHLKSDSIEMIDDIAEATQRASDLTQQLLTFSKGGEPIRKAENIVQILQFCIKLVMSGSKSKCQIVSHKKMHLVNVDFGQIQQVINNILLNADQSMPKGGLIAIKLTNFLKKRTNSEIDLQLGQYVKISISDEGEGIPDTMKEKVFSPYFSTKSKGTGLGLATAYSIIRRHNGFINFESNLGKGTTFHVYLPISKNEKHSILTEKDIKLTKTGKILVLDDNLTVLKMIQKMLHHLKQKVDIVEDGKQVLQKYREAMLKEEPYDIVIMDLTIPGGMGGKEAIQDLYQIDPTVKAIVSSGYSTDPIMANYQEYKFKGILKKPYTIHQIKQLLRDLL